MRKKEVQGRGAHPYTTTVLIPDRNSQTAKTIEETFYAGKGKDKLRMYRMTDGTEFIADVYDRNFPVQPKVTILPEHYKGKNADASKAWMQ